MKIYEFGVVRTSVSDGPGQESLSCMKITHDKIDYVINYDSNGDIYYLIYKIGDTSINYYMPVCDMPKNRTSLEDWKEFIETIKNGNTIFPLDEEPSIFITFSRIKLLLEDNIVRGTIDNKPSPNVREGEIISPEMACEFLSKIGAEQDVIDIVNLWSLNAE